MNPHQPGTLLSNIIPNPENDENCMECTTRGVKQTIDPPMSSVVKIEVVGHNGELVDLMVKEVEIP